MRRRRVRLETGRGPGRTNREAGLGRGLLHCCRCCRRNGFVARRLPVHAVRAPALVCLLADCLRLVGLAACRTRCATMT